MVMVSLGMQVGEYMKLNYRGYDFIGIIGAGLSAYGIVQNQNNENYLLWAGWLAALLLWIAHIIDGILSYSIHCKREEEIDNLNKKIEELSKKINHFTAELESAKRTIDNQQYAITVLTQTTQPQNSFSQVVPRQTQ